VQRAAEQCVEGRESRARASLRTALRQLNATASRLRSRSARKTMPEDIVTELGQRVGASAGDVKVLRDGLVCP